MSDAMTIVNGEMRQALRLLGIECFVEDGGLLADGAVFEPPCSLKWVHTQHDLRLGAFSFGATGFFSDVVIGRYCSFANEVQIGRIGHPLTWLSTSPFFYAYEGEMLDVGDGFAAAAAYRAYRPVRPDDIVARNRRTTHDFREPTIIGNDVWVGHGAFISPGVTIGDGAVVGACAVVTRDVPPYAIFGGNPARVLRMRFDERQVLDLLSLAWWRFAPWQLHGTPFAHIDRAIAHLQELIPSLRPYEARLITVAELLRGP
jgi:acetyltransferase-like isoleucine patch superfamily enzyme